MPIGKNNLAHFMKNIAEKAGWDKNKLWTGYSIRATVLVNQLLPEMVGILSHHAAEIQDPIFIVKFLICHHENRSLQS